MAECNKIAVVGTIGSCDVCAGSGVVALVKGSGSHNKCILYYDNFIVTVEILYELDVDYFNMIIFKKVVICVTLITKYLYKFNINIKTCNFTVVP